jgi:hypothetical protein
VCHVEWLFADNMQEMKVYGKIECRKRGVVNSTIGKKRNGMAELISSAWLHYLGVYL